MTNKYLVSMVVAALIVAGGIYYSVSRKSSGNYSSAPPASINNNSASNTKANGNNASSAEQKADQNVISYTESGFSPKSVTVKAGDTVVFKNEGSRDMWVASAPHPMHTDYPEFDAKKVYKNGEVYSFTFQKAGTWKFHNHVGPTDFGSVVVE